LHEIATFGRALSLPETICAQLYFWRERRMKLKGKLAVLGQEIDHTNEQARIAEERFQHWRKIICDLFIDALLKHDAAAIIELADAAIFLKGKMEEGTQKSSDFYVKLVHLKNLSALNATMHIQDIAKFVGRATDKNSIKYLKTVCDKFKLRYRDGVKLSRKKSD
jgi:hypothetical protein